MMKSFPIAILIPLALFLGLCGTVAHKVIQQNGRLVYPLDDPYIHMAMAKHLAQDGYFGVSEDGFSATSSSPGWTALIGLCFSVFGTADWIPFALNVGIGIGLIILFFVYAQSRCNGSIAATVFACFATMALPLVTMVCTGMEHPLHILLILWIAILNIDQIQNSADDRWDLQILGTAALGSLFRYETIFVLFPLCLLWLMRGRWKKMLSLAIGGFLPIVVIGLVYIQNGWYFFPNSILLKSALNTPASERVLGIFVRMKGQLFGATHLFLPFIVLSIQTGVSMYKREFYRTENLWSFIFVVATISHCAFATIGWFYRYEGYLLAIAFMAAISLFPVWKTYAVQIWQQQRTWQESILQRGFLLVILAWVLMPYFANIASFREVAPGAKNIHEQQFQMGLFIKNFYNVQTIVANDIGAINYLADIDCLDMVGLGSVEPIKASKQYRFNAAFVESWAKLRDAKIAILYFSWFRKAIPPSWIRVADWTLSEKTTVGDPVVSFFAVNLDELDSLRKNLHAFEPLLPQTVSVQYY